MVLMGITWDPHPQPEPLPRDSTSAQCRAASLCPSDGAGVLVSHSVTTPPVLAYGPCWSSPRPMDWLQTFPIITNVPAIWTLSCPPCPTPWLGVVGPAVAGGALLCQPGGPPSSPSLREQSTLSMSWRNKIKKNLKNLKNNQLWIFVAWSGSELLRFHEAWYMYTPYVKHFAIQFHLHAVLARRVCQWDWEEWGNSKKYPKML